MSLSFSLPRWKLPLPTTFPEELFLKPTMPPLFHYQHTMCFFSVVHGMLNDFHHLQQCCFPPPSVCLTSSSILLNFVDLKDAHFCPPTWFWTHMLYVQVHYICSISHYCSLEEKMDCSFGFQIIELLCLCFLKRSSWGLCNHFPLFLYNWWPCSQSYDIKNNFQGRDIGTWV